MSLAGAADQGVVAGAAGQEVVAARGVDAVVARSAPWTVLALTSPMMVSSKFVPVTFSIEISKSTLPLAAGQALEQVDEHAVGLDLGVAGGVDAVAAVQQVAVGDRGRVRAAVQQVVARRRRSARRCRRRRTCSRCRLRRRACHRRRHRSMSLPPKPSIYQVLPARPFMTSASLNPRGRRRRWYREFSHNEKSFPRLGAAEVPGIVPGDGGSAVALLLGMSCRTLAEYFLCSSSVSAGTTVAGRCVAKISVRVKNYFNCFRDRETWAPDRAPRQPIHRRRAERGRLRNGEAKGSGE